MKTLIPGRLEAFLAQDDDAPIVMLNLLRFAPDAGRARYTDYLTRAAPIVARHGGAIAFAGDGLAALAAEPGQAWDAVALIRYPSRDAFAALIADPDYAPIDALRQAALVEAVLQPVAPLLR